MNWYDRGRVKRKGSIAAVDSNEETKKPICPKCYDSGINIDLIPHVNDARVRDDNYRRCQNCSDIIPVKEMKYETELEDFVDVESANKPSEFVVVEKRRKVRTSSNRYEEEPFQVPELAGRPDTELESMLRDRPGIVTALVDSDIDEVSFFAISLFWCMSTAQYLLEMSFSIGNYTHNFNFSLTNITISFCSYQVRHSC